MKPIQVFLEPDIHKDLKLKAIERGTTVSELVRDAIMGVIDGDVVNVYGTPTIPPKNKTKESVAVSSKPQNSPTIEIPKEVYRAFDKTCKAGHPIPKGRDRCLTKDCKYA